MKRTKMSFAQAFLGPPVDTKGNAHNAFDWDKAAKIIKERFDVHPDLKAEAGLQDDWDNTGGTIFENGKPTNGDCTYLASNWATPTLILSYNGEEQEEIECYAEVNERFHSKTKWDETSLDILGIEL